MTIPRLCKELHEWGTELFPGITLSDQDRKLADQLRGKEGRVDIDELRTGVRREGAFFGVNALLTKPAQSVALALSPFILELTKFISREANQGQIILNQPSGAIFGIKVLVGLIPGIAMLTGAVLLSFYPLKGSYLAEVKEKVLALHAQKHAMLRDG